MKGTPPERCETIITALLTVCKLLYRECHEFLLRKNTFEFLTPVTAPLSSMLSVNSFHRLRDVILGPLQCTAKAAMANMTASRQFIQQNCPLLETLSTRLWLIKHPGPGQTVDIDDSEVPIIDTTWYFDPYRVADGHRLQQTQTQEEVVSPIGYSLGLVRHNCGARQHRGSPRKPFWERTLDVDISAVLDVRFIEEDLKSSVFGLWTALGVMAVLKKWQNDDDNGANGSDAGRLKYDGASSSSTWCIRGFHVILHKSIVDYWTAALEEDGSKRDEIVRYGL